MSAYVTVTYFFFKNCRIIVSVSVYDVGILISENHPWNLTALLQVHTQTFEKGGAKLRIFTKWGGGEGGRILRKFWFWGQNEGCKLRLCWKTPWIWNNLPSWGGGGVCVGGGYSRATLFKFYDNYSNFSGVRIFRNFTISQTRLMEAMMPTVILVKAFLNKLSNWYWTCALCLDPKDLEYGLLYRITACCKSLIRMNECVSVAPRVMVTGMFCYCRFTIIF